MHDTTERKDVYSRITAQIVADLVTKKYIRSLPVDPYAKSAATWIAVLSDDDKDPGVKDVKSGAEGTAPDGTAYATW